MSTSRRMNDHPVFCSIPGWIVSLHLVLTPSILSASAQKPENVIFILIDDLGWSDVGCYGNKVAETSYLDRFTKESIRFTNAYAAAPICSPTRAAILTGKSPAKLQFEFVTKEDGSKPPERSLKQPKFPRDLPLEEQTIAELLNEEYTTGFFGKWHLTQENNRYLGWGQSHGPLQQGFDEGTENRGSHPYGFAKEDRNTYGNFSRGEYPEDKLTQDVIDFLRRNQDQPFFLFWSLYYVHTPVKTRAKWLFDKYQLPDQDIREVEYAAFLETMDHYIGQVLNAVNELGLNDDTWIFITSDNGGHPGYTRNAPLKGSKWTLYEGGIRVPLLIKDPQGQEMWGEIADFPVTSIDYLPTILKITGSKEKDISFPGTDLTPLFHEPNKIPTEPVLTWHFPFYHPPKDYEGTTPCSAIRKGQHKLLYFYENERVELYDLENDLSESMDLTKALPHIVDELKKQLFQHLEFENARFPETKEF